MSGHFEVSPMMQRDPGVRKDVNDLPIAIIGGGIAGLAFSVGLSRNQISHKIYESADCFTQVGAGVALGPNALAVLGAIDPRLRERLQSRLTTNADPRKSNIWLTFRNGMAGAPESGNGPISNGAARFGSLIAEVKANGPTENGRHCIHRGAFLEEIVRLIPAGVAEFGKRLVALEDTGGAVKLTFEDGSRAWASAVVGCDGIWSTVRRIMFQPDDALIKPVYTGDYCYQRLIPMEEARNMLGDDMAMNGNIFCGRNGYVTAYPLDNHQVVNFVAVTGQNEDTLPDPEWPQRCGKDSMLQDFEGWGLPILHLLSGIENPQRWGLLESSRAKTYAKGRFCLLGDAAHASTPHQGASVGMTLEGALILSQLIQRSQKSGNVVSAFFVFDKIRRPRTQRFINTSRAAGQVFKLTHEGLMDDFVKIRENLLARHSWIWDFNVSRELKKATWLYDTVTASKSLRTIFEDDKWGIPSELDIGENEISREQRRRIEDSEEEEEEEKSGSGNPKKIEAMIPAGLLD